MTAKTYMTTPARGASMTRSGTRPAWRFTAGGRTPAGVPPRRVGTHGGGTAGRGTPRGSATGGRRRPCRAGRTGRGAPASRAGLLGRLGHVDGQPLPQKEAGPVHARLDGGQADPERLRDLRVRQPLHVVHDKGRPVVGRQALDRPREHLPELPLQRVLVHPRRPVVHRLEVPSLLVERGKELLPRELALPALARAQLLVRSVRGDPVEPAPERRGALEHVDLLDGGPERVLRDLLGVFAQARDLNRKPVDPLTVRVDELVCG